MLRCLVLDRLDLDGLLDGLDFTFLDAFRVLLDFKEVLAFKEVLTEPLVFRVILPPCIASPIT
jgi:hypothetical protein